MTSCPASRSRSSTRWWRTLGRTANESAQGPWALVQPRLRRAWARRSRFVFNWHVMPLPTWPTRRPRPRTPAGRRPPIKKMPQPLPLRDEPAADDAAERARDAPVRRVRDLTLACRVAGAPSRPMCGWRSSHPRGGTGADVPGRSTSRVLATDPPDVRAYHIRRGGVFEEDRSRVSDGVPENPVPLTNRLRTFEWASDLHRRHHQRDARSFSGDGIEDRRGRPPRRADVEAGATSSISARSPRALSSPPWMPTWMGPVKPVLGAVRSAAPSPSDHGRHNQGGGRAARPGLGADAITTSRVPRDGGMARVVAQAVRPRLMHNQRGREFGVDVIRDTRAVSSAASRVRRGGCRASGSSRSGLRLGGGRCRTSSCSGLGELRDLGRPLMIGTSRKSSIGYIIDRRRRNVSGAPPPRCAGDQQGGRPVRVHAWNEMVQVARVQSCRSPGRAGTSAVRGALTAASGWRWAPPDDREAHLRAAVAGLRAGASKWTGRPCTRSRRGALFASRRS